MHKIEIDDEYEYNFLLKDSTFLFHSPGALCSTTLANGDVSIPLCEKAKLAIYIKRRDTILANH